MTATVSANAIAPEGLSGRPHIRGIHFGRSGARSGHWSRRPRHASLGDPPRPSRPSRVSVVPMAPILLIVAAVTLYATIDGLAKLMVQDMDVLQIIWSR